MAKRINPESVVLVLIGLFIGGMLGSIIIEKKDPAQAVAAEARPFHGRLEVSTSRQRVAPFKIVTPEGSRGYLVKLVDAGTGQTAMSVFLESGRTFETDAPLGSYILRWASGHEWINDEKLFGALTDIQEAEDLLVFKEDSSGHLGHTIELTPKIDGNLDSDRIGAGSF